MTRQDAPDLRGLLSQAQRALAAGQLPHAEDLLARARKATPESPHVRYLLGLLRHRQGRHEDALDHLRAALPDFQNDPHALFNYATVLVQQERYDEAAAPLRRCLSLKPDHEDAALQLGVVLAKTGQTTAAAEAFRAVLGRNPEHAVAQLNLAALMMDDRPEAALSHAQRAAGALPERRRAPALNLQAKALAVLGREDQAAVVYDRVLQRDPDDIRARFGDAILLPRVYRSEEEIEHWRERYCRKLEAFVESLRLDCAERIAVAADAVFHLGNFALPQQGRNDRDAQAVYGALLHRVAAARYPDYARPPGRPPRRPRGRPTSRGRPRIGFASAYLRQHSIAKTHGRWLTGLDPGRFEVFAVHTGTACDAVTQSFADGCEHFRHHPRLDASLLQLLRSLDLDVLIYPDLGMEPAMLLPAALPLAPVQCQGLGHPVTSGLPTVHWAISSALMEPPGAEAHYTENLVCLGNLSFCYDRERIARDREAGGPAVPRRHGIVYLCTQNLGKLLPQHDEVFVRILAAVPDSELWFLARPESEPTERFRVRLLTQCQAHGVAPERIVIHDRLDQSGFLALNAAADIYLDGLAWSGNNTTFEALAMGLPVVTCPGEVMRARHSAAMLTMMGLEDTLAGSLDRYVEIATRLGLDPAWRAAVTEKTRARGAVIYDDETPIRDLEAFLTRVSGGSSGDDSR